MTDYCEYVDCNEIAIIKVGPEGKNMCLIHITRYQKDLADRVISEGDPLR